LVGAVAEAVYIARIASVSSWADVIVGKLNINSTANPINITAIALYFILSLHAGSESPGMPNADALPSPLRMNQLEIFLSLSIAEFEAQYCHPWFKKSAPARLEKKPDFVG
jgi:hypothetical protein